MTTNRNQIVGSGVGRACVRWRNPIAIRTPSCISGVPGTAHSWKIIGGRSRTLTWGGTPVRLTANNGQGGNPKFVAERVPISRGHIFVRFADDQLILLKSPRATERVRDSMTRFIEDELKLKVNREKTEVGSLRSLKFLGFKLTRTKEGTGIAIHPKAIKKFKKRVIAITKRNRGVSLERVLSELKSYMKGWIGYFGVCPSDNTLKMLDDWVRRRVRQYAYKQWKTKYNRVRNLKRLCPKYFRASDGAVLLEWTKVCWGVVRSNSYWHAVRNPAVHQAMSNSWLKEQGMFYLLDDWSAVKERWTNRRMPQGKSGGVRGQPTD